MTRAALASVRRWPARRWATAAVATVVVALLVAVPTDLVDTPYFSREIPPTWWSWPALAASALLSGLVVATYVDPPRADDTGSRSSLLGGALTFFAVGCPVCNKLVLLLLGTSGALAWFEPVQPLLQVAAVALLGWALVARLRGEVACTLTDPDARGAVRA